MGTLNRIQGFLKSKIDEAKSVFTFTTHKAKLKVEEFTIPTFSSSRSSKDALSRRLRNYRQFRRHKNRISAMSRKINWGIK
jgi:hypothetical protein